MKALESRILPTWGLIIFFLHLSLASAHAAHPTTFAEVEKHLLLNPGINSVDKFLGSLSEDFRNKFILIYSSRSLHKACAHATNPRIVMNTAEKSNLVMAVANPSGHPDCNADEVEFMEFKPAEARYELHSIDFSGPAPKISPPNPTKCLGCHSADPRPIWEQYSNWPGLYGSLDDNIMTKEMLRPWHKELPIEYAGYESFMAKERHQGIYKHLNWANGRDKINYFRFNEASEPPDYNQNDYLKYRPNFEFDVNVRKNNRSRINRLLRTDPNFDSFKHAMYYVRECGPWPSRKGGVERLHEIISGLPQSTLDKFIPTPLPQSPPQEVLKEFEANRDPSVFAPYNTYALINLQIYQSVRQRSTQLLPSSWYGYLQMGHPLNPTNTELPRRPVSEALDFPAFLDPDRQLSEGGAAIEYFMNIQGKTTRSWSTHFERPIPVFNYILDKADVGNKPCEEVKKLAIQAINEWAAKRSIGASSP